MRKIISMVMVLCMITSLFSAMPVTVFAATDGTCGDNLTWTLDDEGTLTISGTGDMYDYDWENGAPWYESRDSIEKVVMENGITTIGYSAFGNCKRLTGITIPDSVITIGYKAFCRCEGLTNVTIGNGVKTIGYSAFAGCYSLTNLTIGESVTSISDYAFSNCYSLTDIYYSGTIEQWDMISVGSYNEIFTSAVKHIGAVTPTPEPTPTPDSIITSGTCGDNLTWTLDDEGKLIISGTGEMTDFGSYSVPWYEIGDSIKEVVIENGVTTIEYGAFSGCENLTDITVPDSITTIEKWAFSNCGNLTKVTIPDSVTIIGDYAFSQCEGLTNVTIGNGVTTIEYGTFAWCSNLTDVIISDSVTSIGNSAFYRCDNIADVYYSGTEEEWNNISIGSDNKALTNANIHFNHVPDEPDISVVYGDVNGDGLINVNDVVLLVEYIGTLSSDGQLDPDKFPAETLPGGEESAKLTADDLINVNDVVLLVEYIGTISSDGQLDPDKFPNGTFPGAN